MEQPDPAPPPRGRAPISRRALLVRLLLGLAITGLFVGLLLRFVDWQRVIALSRQTRWGVLALSFFPYLLIYVARSHRFWLVAPKTPYVTMQFVTCVHTMMLRLLPMRTGELSYALLVRRIGSAGFGEGILSLVLIRLLDAVVVVLIFSITLALNRALFRGDSVTAFVGSGVIVVVGALTVIFFNRLAIFGLRVLVGVARLTRLDRSPRARRLLDRLSESVYAFAQLPFGVLLKVALTTVIHWLLVFAMIHITMLAFGVQVTPAQSVLGGTAAVVAGFLPIAGIGTFGTLEAGWALGFVLVGFPTDLAVASALGFSLSTLAYALLLGLVGWVGLAPYSRRRSMPSDGSSAG